MNRASELLEKVYNEEVLSAPEAEELELLLKDKNHYEDMAFEALLRAEFSPRVNAKSVVSKIIKSKNKQTANQVVNTLKKRQDIKTKPLPWKPLLFIAAACLAIGFFALFQNFQQSKLGTNIHYTKIDESQIFITRNGQNIDAPILQSGDTIITKGHIDVQRSLEDGTLLTFSPQTQMTLKEENLNWQLGLNNGKIKLNVRPQKGSLQVNTKDVNVLVVGTRFSVEQLINGSRISVTEGKVKVKLLGTEEVITLLAGDDIVATDNKVISSNKILKTTTVFEINPNNGSKKQLHVGQLQEQENQKCFSGVVGETSAGSKARIIFIRDFNGLFKHQDGLKLKFRYWLGHKGYWLGIWMRSDANLKTAYTSINNLRYNQWTEVEIPLSQLVPKDTNKKFSTGDIISSLQIQTDGNPETQLFISELSVISE
jgi:hypothetical protein